MQPLLTPNLSETGLPPRILIIDDNPSIHRDFDLVLADEIENPELEADEERVYGTKRPPAPGVSTRYVLDHAMSGLAGVEKVKESLAAGQPYQLAFVDVRMPGIDGVEAIARIWGLDPRIQMVICTAYADYTHLDLIQRLGHTDKLLVLKKPFDTIEVTQLASTLTAKWFLARQAALKLEEMELLVARRTRRVLELQGSGSSEQRATTVEQHPTPDDAEPDDSDSPESQQLVVLLAGRREAFGEAVIQGLSQTYRVVEADHGDEGLFKAQELVPDMILAETSETSLDGLEFCRRVKALTLTSHIPVILLTATDSTPLSLQAVEAGADGVIANPIHVPLLQTRMEGLLRTRRELRHQPAKGVPLHPRDLAADQADALFVGRVMAVTEQQLSDFEFDVEALAKAAAVSRRQLFRKLKAVINTTPKALIRSARLKRAAELLLDSPMTVAEITYAVGFSDVKHFRNLFREEYGVVPSEYIERGARKPRD